MKRHAVLDLEPHVRRQAKASLKHIRSLVAGRPSAFNNLSIPKAIERIRTVREELWRRKLAARP